MTRILALALTLACLTLPLSAQDSPPPAAASGQAGWRFFEKPIDFWKRGRTYEDDRPDAGRSQERPAKPEPASSDWGQLVRLESGEMAWRDLPAPLVRLLENPTPSNVEAYFAWRVERTRKLLRAAELLKNHRGLAAGRTGGEAEPPPPAVESRPAKAAPLPKDPAAPSAEVRLAEARFAEVRLRVTYFHRKGCPPCDRQDPILAEWLKDHPESSLEVVEAGERPALWREHRVRGTPSLLLHDSLTGRSRLVEGFADRGRLDEALTHLRQPSGANSPPPPLPTLLLEGNR